MRWESQKEWAQRAGEREHIKKAVGWRPRHDTGNTLAKALPWTQDLQPAPVPLLVWLFPLRVLSPSALCSGHACSCPLSLTVESGVTLLHNQDWQLNLCFYGSPYNSSSQWRSWKVLDTPPNVFSRIHLFILYSLSSLLFSLAFFNQYLLSTDCLDVLGFLLKYSRSIVLC